MKVVDNPLKRGIIMLSIVVCVIAVILSFLKVALLEHEEDKATKSDKEKKKEV